MTGAACGAGNAYLSGAPDFTSGFYGDMQLDKPGLFEPDTPKDMKMQQLDCQGWQFAQVGPSFHDLRTICGVDIEQGSWIITVNCVMYGVGSLLGGLVVEKVDRKLLFAVLHFALTGTFLAIPWCSRFWLMLLVFAIQGLLQGAMEPVGYTEVLSTWKKHKRVVLLGTNFVYCIGTILAPLATAPFLSEIVKHNITNSTNKDHGEFETNKYNIFQNDSAITMTREVSFRTGNITENESFKQVGDSNLFIAFLISAFICFTISFCFLIAFWYRGNRIPNEDPETDQPKIKPPPSFLLYSTLILLGSIFCVSVGIDGVFHVYLPQFCVIHFGWKQNKSAFILSTVYLAALGGSAVGIVIAKFLNSLPFVGGTLTISLLAMGGFTVSVMNHFEIGVWIFGCIEEFAKVNTVSLLYTWTSEYITPVTGRIASFFVVASMVGNSLNTLLVGYLIDEVDTMWFAYTIVIQILVLVILYSICSVITKCVIPKYRVNDAEPENMACLQEYTTNTRAKQTYNE